MEFYFDAIEWNGVSTSCRASRGTQVSEIRETIGQSSGCQPFNRVAPETYNHFHGPVTVNSVMVSIGIGQEHFVERFQFIDVRDNYM